MGAVRTKTAGFAVSTAFQADDRCKISGRTGFQISARPKGKKDFLSLNGVPLPYRLKNFPQLQKLIYFTICGKAAFNAALCPEYRHGKQD